MWEIFTIGKYGQKHDRTDGDALYLTQLCFINGTFFPSRNFKVLTQFKYIMSRTGIVLNELQLVLYVL